MIKNEPDNNILSEDFEMPVLTADLGEIIEANIIGEAEKCIILFINITSGRCSRKIKANDKFKSSKTTQRMFGYSGQYKPIL